MQSRAAEREKQMVEGGRIEREVETVVRKSSVTAESHDPDAEQDLTLTSCSLLNCSERQTAVFLYLGLVLNCFLFDSSVSRLCV